MKRIIIRSVIGVMILGFISSLPFAVAQEVLAVPLISDFDVVFENVVFEKVTKITPEPTWQFPESSEIRVVNESGEPLAGVKVSVAALNDQNHSTLEYNEFYREEFFTNQNGVAILTYHGFDGKTYDGLKVIASWDDRYLPMSLTLLPAQSSSGVVSTVTVPEKMKAILVPAKTVTRQVVDEADGKGIEGVVVFFHPQINTAVFRTRTDKNDADRVFLDQLERTRITVVTDQNGFCEIGLLPQEDNWIKIDHFFIEHPAYFYLTPRSKDDDLIPERFTMVKKPEVVGRVTDSDGNPVADVTLTVPSYRIGVKTDQDGHFHFFSPSPNSGYDILFQASGMSSVAVKLQPEHFQQPLNVTMQKGRVIRVHAVDEQGETISPIVVRNYYAIYAVGPGNYPIRTTDIVGRMLENGIWEWSDAPRGELLAWVHHQTETGRFSNQYVAELPCYRFLPRDEPYTVKMLPFDKEQPRPLIPAAVGWTVPPKMVLRVVDYDTGEPCADASVTVLINSAQIRSAIPPSFNTINTLPANYHLMRSYTFRSNETFRTDDRGLVGLDFSELEESGIHSLVVTVGKENYADISRIWSSIQYGQYGTMAGPPATAAAPPDTTFEMLRSFGIGGLRRFGPPIPEVLDVALVKNEE